MNSMNRIKDIITTSETKEITIFNTYNKYITQDFVGRAEDILRIYGSEYVVTCEECEKGIDIFI